MPDVEHRIAAWRAEMTRAGLSSTALDELEAHLRDQTAELIRAGLSEETAFQNAAQKLGNPAAMRKEFEKLHDSPRSEAKLKFAIWTGAFLLLAVGFAAKDFSHDLSSLLLFGHVFTLTAGYLIVILSCIAAISYAIGRWTHKMKPVKEESFARTTRFFNGLAAVSVGVGFLLGSIWARLSWGKFFSADPREIGTLCIFGWLLLTVIMRRTSRASLPMTIMGSMFVCIVWFGAGMWSGGLHSYGAMSYLPLEILVAAHLLFLALALLPMNVIHLGKAQS